MNGKCVSLLLLTYQIVICSSVFNGKIVALIEEEAGDGLPLLTPYSEEFPYMIEILENDHHLCGATLIKLNVVLTAAHCLPENKSDLDVANYKVVGGNQLKADLHSPMVQWRNVKKIIQHRLFDNVVRDVALMQTDRDFEQNDYIRPINLPVGYDKNDFNGKLVVQLGWGDMEDGNSSDLLLSMQSTVRPTRGCIDKWYQKYVFKNKVHEHSMLCTQGFKGSVECFGDSGGPTVIHYKNDPSRDIIIGIASAVFDLPDQSCDPKRPNLIGNVATFFTWINNTINKHF